MRRNSSLKNIAFVLALVVLTALILCACNNLPIKSVELNYSNEKAYTVGAEGELTSVPDNLSLDIAWVNGGVLINIDPTLETVRFHEVSEGANPNNQNTMRYMLDGSTLRIKYAKSGKVVIGELQKFLYISVPDGTWLEDVKVVNSTGSTIIENVSANKVNCTSVSGAVTVNCTAAIVEVGSLSADVSIGGNILEVKVDSASGSTTVDCAQGLHKLKVENTSGEVVLRIRENTGFKLDFQTVTGLFINAFDKETTMQGQYYVYKSGNNFYEVETLSGKLTLEKLHVVTP